MRLVITFNVKSFYKIDVYISFKLVFLAEHTLPHIFMELRYNVWNKMMHKHI